MRVRPSRPGDAPSPELSVSESRERTVDLPFGFHSVAVARGRLASDLVACGVGEPDRSDVLVVLSELMANAVRHARPLPQGRVRASWRIEDGRVEVAVVDGGAPHPPEAAHPALVAGSGRGLVIVESLTRAWGVDGAGTDQQRVWAVLPR
jgi:anti-sigma regulatory factor (Ser/Thr protein kinase)